MALLENGKIIPDAWTFIPDGEPVPADRPAIVTLARLKAEAAALALPGRPLGVRLTSAELAPLVAEYLDGLSLVAVEFPKFRDGRGFSTARELRERYGFRGEIRAVGHVLPDQYRFLLRTGFTTVEIPDGQDPAAWAAMLDSVDLAYQRGVDAPAPVSLLRRRLEKYSLPQGEVQGSGGDLEARVAELNRRYGHLSGEELLRPVLTEALKGRVALVSSFGAESAVLLHQAAQIDPATPVIFLNTGKLFGETRSYRDKLVKLLGLTDVREQHPDPAEEKAEDADGLLWRTDANACCALRKVRPLEAALAPFGAWITGRKRYQAATRAVLPAFEAVDGRIKVNPLAGWTPEQVQAYLDRHDLPRHPLVADGFLSIGCMPCTDRVAPGEDARAGRWRGQGKTECGIHQPAPAAVRAAR